MTFLHETAVGGRASQWTGGSSYRRKRERRRRRRSEGKSTTPRKFLFPLELVSSPLPSATSSFPPSVFPTVSFLSFPRSSFLPRGVSRALLRRSSGVLPEFTTLRKSARKREKEAGERQEDREREKAILSPFYSFVSGSANGCGEQGRRRQNRGAYDSCGEASERRRLSRAFFSSFSSPPPQRLLPLPLRSYVPSFVRTLVGSFVRFFVCAFVRSLARQPVRPFVRPSSSSSLFLSLRADL